MRPVDDIIPPGPAGPQILPADGFDGQRDRCRHDAHTALPVPPPTAGGATHGEGAPDRRVHPEHGGRM